MKTLRKSKGFSLIELLVVIAIIGVLSAVGITAYTGYTASAKEQASRTQFAQMVSLSNALTYWPQVARPYDLSVYC